MDNLLHQHIYNARVAHKDYIYNKIAGALRWSG
jgi:hypothetical protein